jgi:hypothetical protein
MPSPTDPRWLQSQPNDTDGGCMANLLAWAEPADALVGRYEESFQELSLVHGE